MPILIYFAVAGSALLALLFVADANMGPSKPSPLNNEFYGLASAPHPKPKSIILARTLAPAPDMKSDPVQRASEDVPTSMAGTQAIAKAEPPPPKHKRFARRPKPVETAPVDRVQTFAWSRRMGGGLF
jgi:hypothetical protein